MALWLELLLEPVVDLVEGGVFERTIWKSAWNCAAVNATPPATTPVVFSNTPSSSGLSLPLEVLPVPAAAQAGVPDPVDLLVPHVD